MGPQPPNQGTVTQAPRYRLTFLERPVDEARKHMFGISGGEFAVLLLLALLIFGPDQLPKAAQQVGRVLRQLRKMANSASNDIKEGLGPEYKDFDVQDLNPKRFVQKHFWEDEEDEKPKKAAGLNGKRPPFDDEAT